MGPGRNCEQVRKSAVVSSVRLATLTWTEFRRGQVAVGGHVRQVLGGQVVQRLALAHDGRRDEGGVAARRDGGGADDARVARNDGRPTRGLERLLQVPLQLHHLGNGQHVVRATVSRSTGSRQMRTTVTLHSASGSEVLSLCLQQHHCAD